MQKVCRVGPVHLDLHGKSDAGPWHDNFFLLGDRLQRLDSVASIYRLDEVRESWIDAEMSPWKLKRPLVPAR